MIRSIGESSVGGGGTSSSVTSNDTATGDPSEERTTSSRRQMPPPPPRTAQAPLSPSEASAASPSFVGSGSRRSYSKNSLNGHSSHPGMLHEAQPLQNHSQRQLSQIRQPSYRHDDEPSFDSTLTTSTFQTNDFSYATADTDAILAFWRKERQQRSGGNMGRSLVLRLPRMGTFKIITIIRSVKKMSMETSSPSMEIHSVDPDAAKVEDDAVEDDNFDHSIFSAFSQLDFDGANDDNDGDFQNHDNKNDNGSNDAANAEAEHVTTQYSTQFNNGSSNNSFHNRNHSTMTRKSEESGHSDNTTPFSNIRPGVRYPQRHHSSDNFDNHGNRRHSNESNRSLPLRRRIGFEDQESDQDSRHDGDAQQPLQQQRSQQHQSRHQPQHQPQHSPKNDDFSSDRNTTGNKSGNSTRQVRNNIDQQNQTHNAIDKTYERDEQEDNNGLLTHQQYEGKDRSKAPQHHFDADISVISYSYNDTESVPSDIC
ncbi:LOW QUALITY PROTEIN: hypothetical protein ACHAXS_004667 [Conticribra weissflogii]